MFDWRTSPVHCQAFASLAGANYKDNIPADSGRIRYCRTHYVKENVGRLHRGGQCVLITSSSDAVVVDAGFLPQNVKAWYSTNSATNNERVHPIPIGFVFNQERFQSMLQVDRTQIDRDCLMYVNFTCYRSDSLRHGLYQRFRGESWVTTKGGQSFGDVSPSEYYTDLKRHRFVLSPPGAGPDCHRHWEALVMGAIPIVRSSRALRLLEGLPVLMVDDLAKVTREKLEEEYERLSPLFSNLDLSLLSIDYWKEKLRRWAN